MIRRCDRFHISSFRFAVIFLLLATLTIESVAQASDTVVQTVNKKRLRTFVIASSATYVVSMVALNNLWYSNSPREPFHFFNDGDEWLQMDKVGHFYSAFQLSYIGSKSLQWANVPKRKSDFAGSLISFGILASIEVMDGFSSSYGASVYDLAANAAGSAFYVGQNLLWDEVRIYPKFSFQPTSFADERPDVLGENLAQQIFKDYNGQTYWLSVDMDKFCRFPKWLNLAVGYGATGMISATNDYPSTHTPMRQFYLGLDLDLTAIHTKSKALKTILFFANMIKVPFPTLEFSKDGTKAYAFYF
jgi:uncharacterized protein YfiM (DUF2279 family)